MEDTMFDLFKICHHKQFLCIHDDIDNLIKSALDSKLLPINSINPQRLDKKEQEVKNVEEQPAERRNRAENITPETESDEVTKSNAENLLPILSKCEVTLEDEIECDMPAKDDDNSQQEEIDIVTSSDDVLPPSDENDDDYDLLLEEVDLFLSDNSIPPGIENIADDPEGDICFLEELLIDNSPDMIAEEISDKLNKDKGFDPGREINVSTKIEDDNYFPFMFVIRFFLPYFIFPEVSPFLLSAESEDTIFDP
nr:hypothetical protein [Tanacetum cinerariifolium]